MLEWKYYISMVGHRNVLTGKLFFSTANSQSEGYKDAPKYPLQFEDHVCCLLESWFGLDRSKVTPTLRDWAYKEHNSYNKLLQTKAKKKKRNGAGSDSDQQHNTPGTQKNKDLGTVSKDNNNNDATNDLNTEDVLEGLVGEGGLVQLDLGDLLSFM